MKPRKPRAGREHLGGRHRDGKKQRVRPFGGLVVGADGGLSEPDHALCGTLPGLTTSGKKLSSSMSKDSNHSLLHWTSPVGSLLNSSLLGLPLKNPVHPPPSTVPTSETLDRLIILAHHYPPSST
ncbi:hypothetical protein AMECASPLE_023575 [Ameca splendens]|uniref:Uncharacterized protein n=1 Tax=Ameca splendens TaxID=208324 RepID=A0ABV0ZPW3_9TELE